MHVKNTKRDAAMIGTRSMKQYLSDFWAITRLYDKHTFLSNIINMAPEGSIWTVQGVEDFGIISGLDSCKVADGGQPGIPDLHFKGVRRYLLNKENKKKIISQIPNWNLDENLYSQHIFVNKDKIFISYHCMQEHYTWVSHQMDLSIMEEMQQHFIMRFDKPGNSAY